MNLELLKKILKYKGIDNKFVYLRKDEQGYYIEYAFKEGCPHDNRCLSKYVTGKRNAEKALQINQIYELSAYTCSHECEIGDNHCSPGHVKKDCSYVQHQDWTYEDPGKCACWDLRKIDLEKHRITVTLQELDDFLIKNNLYE